MSKKLDQLKDHYIVCGYGRMGREVCESLINNEVPFMVIEKEAEKMNSINGIKVLPGIQDELKEIAGKLGMDFELRK